MKEKDIRQLMEQCIAFFQEKNYTKNRIGVYKTLWKSGIVPFMEAQGLKVYNPSIGAMFIDTCHYNGTVRPQEREKIRSIQVLDHGQVCSDAFPYFIPISQLNLWRRELTQI